MATRAAIIYFDPEKLEAVSTYNHYDGYPENLGAGLEAHYNDDFKANRIASEGYISYLDPETGDVEVSNPRDKDVDPERMRLTDDMGQTAMDLAEMISSYGADYAYIWSPVIDKWMTIKGGSTKSMYTTIDQLMPELFGMGTNPENDPQAGDFANEGSMDIVDKAKTALKGEDGAQVKMYMSSLSNDIRLNGDKSYKDFEEDDWQEDFREYIADKSSMEESIKSKWKHRAGIIK